MIILLFVHLHFHDHIYKIVRINITLINNELVI